MIYIGNCLEILSSLPEKSVHTCITSPPYWGLRDYGVDSQLGLEPTPQKYVENLVSVFREVRRVLRDDGTVWLNLGDSYCGGGRAGKNPELKSKHINFGKVQDMSTYTSPSKIPEGMKPKDLCGMPWRVAFGLQADGWYLRQDIIWAKPNPMPESVRDRCTKSHEYLFLLSKSSHYYYDHEAIKEPSVSQKSSGNKTHKYVGTGDSGHQYKEGLLKSSGVEWTTRNKRSVWTVSLKPYRGAHFATFPPDLIEPCVLAGSPVGGTVLDPFFGAGTTGLVSMRHGREYLGIELNPEYAELAKQRLSAVQTAIQWS
tara:strand:+ start:7006 stop:7944 length:939 start_codon:yes stop_codon:yes gene_type:complete